MSAQHTPSCLCVECGYPIDDCGCSANGPKWISHVVSVRAASGAIVITTQKGRTQQEAQERAEQFFQRIGVRHGH